MWSSMYREQINIICSVGTYSNSQRIHPSLQLPPEPSTVYLRWASPTSSTTGSVSCYHKPEVTRLPGLESGIVESQFARDFKKAISPVSVQELGLAITTSGYKGQRMRGFICKLLYLPGLPNVYFTRFLHTGFILNTRL